MKRLHIREPNDKPTPCPDCGARLVFREIPETMREEGDPACAWRCGACRCWWVLPMETVER